MTLLVPHGGENVNEKTKREKCVEPESVRRGNFNVNIAF